MMRILRNALILSVFAAFASAASSYALPPEDFEVTMNIEFRQSDARQMLGMINEFRKSVGDPSKGGTAWYWNKDDASVTLFNGAGQEKLGELAYDYSLEEFAMVRAAEAAYRFGHTRPNGVRSLYAPEMSVYGASGENLAMNMSNSPSATFVQLREDDKSYSDQGHRRNMLMNNKRAVAVGIAVYNGRYYTAQLFGGSVRGASETAPVNGKKDISFTVKASTVGSAEEPKVLTPNVSVAVGDTADAPKVSQMVHCLENRSISFGDFIINNVQWVPDDPSVVSFESGGKLRGLKAGTTTIMGTVFGGKSVSAVITVSENTAAPSDEPSSAPGTGSVDMIGDSSASWSGSGTLSFTVRSSAQFSSVTCGGRTLERMYDYMLAAGSAGATVVTFTERFLGSLTHGTASQIEIRFSDGGTAFVSVTPSGTAGDPSPAPSHTPDDDISPVPSNAPGDDTPPAPSNAPGDDISPIPSNAPGDDTSPVPPNTPGYIEPIPSDAPYTPLRNDVVPPANTFMPLPGNTPSAAKSMIFTVKGCSPFGSDGLIMSNMSGLPVAVRQLFVMVKCGERMNVIRAVLSSSQYGMRTVRESYAQIITNADGIDVLVPPDALFVGQNSISLGGKDDNGCEMRTTPFTVTVSSDIPPSGGGHSSAGCSLGIASAGRGGNAGALLFALAPLALAYRIGRKSAERP